MKPYFISFFVILTFMFLTGCNQTKTAFEKSTQKDINALPNVSVSTMESSYDKNADSITVTFLNQTDQEYLYGQSYSLELLDGSDWTVVPFKKGVGWEDIGYTLPAKSNKEMTYSIKNDIGSLKAGTYRVVTHVTELSGSTPHTLAAEFSVR